MVGIQLLVATFFGFFRGRWRYVGIVDVVRLVVGMTAALGILVATWYLGDNFGFRQEMVKMPRGVLLVDWAFALLTLFGARVLIRIGRDRTRSGQVVGPAQKKVLIIGAGDAGEALAREVEHRPQLGMKVVSFVDDHRAKWESLIRGIQVRGPIASVPQIADETGADEALIAIPSVSGKRIREIIHHLSDADLHFKTMPGIDQLVSGKVHVTQLRPVNVEDLLRREKIEILGTRCANFPGKTGARHGRRWNDRLGIGADWIGSTVSSNCRAAMRTIFRSYLCRRVAVVRRDRRPAHLAHPRSAARNGRGFRRDVRPQRVPTRCKEPSRLR